ncbi:MAG: bestrophin family ion channel [Aggregatilineales bacterium]
MILKKQLNLRKAIPYVQYELTLGAMTSVAVYGLYELANLQQIAIPNLLPAVLGTALAIFLGFRNSAAYTRWGEAAQLWASIANYSRIFARLIITFVESHNHTPQYESQQAQAFHREMIYRHLAWVNALRLQLRRQSDWDSVAQFLTDEDRQALRSKQNKPTALMLMQGHRIYDGMRNSTLQGFDSFQLEGCLAQLSAYQAQCERIKAIPIPRQYTFFTRLFVWVFIMLIPFSFVQTFANAGMTWLVIPVTLLLAFVFGIVERTGTVNEEPFENRITDVPMSAYCVDIERDLREMLNETDLPDSLQPQNGYLF